MRKQRIVSVTGNAEQDFESDLIVWTASFRVQRATLSEAYTEIERERTVVQDYLQKAGLKADSYSFGSLDVSQNYRRRHTIRMATISRYPMVTSSRRA